jgi:hypothetical protein
LPLNLVQACFLYLPKLKVAGPFCHLKHWWRD